MRSPYPTHVRVELRLDLHVLLQVGYDPENVSGLELVEAWHNVIHVGEEIVVLHHDEARGVEHRLDR